MVSNFKAGDRHRERIEIRERLTGDHIKGTQLGDGPCAISRE